MSENFSLCNTHSSNQGFLQTAISQFPTFTLQIRISNDGNVKYAEWALPAGRDESTFWNHETSEATVSSDTLQDVDVTYKDTTEDGATCKQNRYGIMPGAKAGGGYPATHVTGGPIFQGK